MDGDGTAETVLTTHDAWDEAWFMGDPPVTGVAVADDGTLYVTGWGFALVADPVGEVLARYNIDGNRIAVHPDGHMYVAESVSGELRVVVDPLGEGGAFPDAAESGVPDLAGLGAESADAEPGVFDTLPNMEQAPQTLDVDAGGALYLGDLEHLTRLDPAGAVSAVHRTPDLSCAQVADDGSVFYTAGGRLYRVHPDGAIGMLAGGGKVHWELPEGAGPVPALEAGTPALEHVAIGGGIVTSPRPPGRPPPSAPMRRSPSTSSRSAAALTTCSQNSATTRPSTSRSAIPAQGRGRRRPRGAW